MDEISEKEKGNMKIGTTKKGIGPAYVDKYSRNGIRVCDLIHEDSLEEKLVFQLEQKKEFLLKNYKFELSRKSISEIKDKYHEYGKKIKKYIIDGSYFLKIKI